MRRETGKEQRVQVPYGEGRANHTDAVSCVLGREALDEALTGERVGQVLSRESPLIQGADAVRVAEGKTVRVRERECSPDPAWSETLARPEAPCAGTGRSHDWPPYEGRSASGRLEGRSR